MSEPVIQRVSVPARLLAAALLAAGLAGCSSIGSTVDEYIPKPEPAYKTTRRLPPLEVPPDLDSSTINDTLRVPAGRGTTYTEYSNQGNGQVASAGAASGVLPDFTGIEVVRRGDERWLLVEASPGEVWPKIRDFWLEQGFILELEDPSIGIMETDWAEERSRMSTGLISGFLSKLSSSLYGAATRDKFRTRLERGEQRGVTEIYVSHRGAEEIVKDDLGPLARRSGEEVKAWQPRPADPELEAEMLNRMMVFMGITEDRAGSLIAQGPQRPDRARMVRERSGGSVLSLQDDFSRAWRRTGLALDRVGFTVEDRDRSRGLYFVRYVDPDQDLGNQDKGFLSRLKFWGDDDKPERTEYLISLIGGERTTQVIVLDKEGERDSSNTATRILGLLHEQLR